MLTRSFDKNKVLPVQQQVKQPASVEAKPIAPIQQKQIQSKPLENKEPMPMERRTRAMQSIIKQKY